MNALDERNAEIVKHYRNGNSLAEVGEMFDLSRERVRQIIKAVDPDATKRKLRSVSVIEDDQETVEERRKAAEAAGAYCVLCGSVVERRAFSNRAMERGGFALTCSNECAEDYPVIRDLVDERSRREYRQTQARYVLKHPERHDDSMTRWAKRCLKDEAATRTPSFHLGSNRHRLAVKYGLTDIGLEVLDEVDVAE